MYTVGRKGFKDGLRRKRGDVTTRNDNLTHVYKEFPIILNYIELH